LNKLKLMKK